MPNQSTSETHQPKKPAPATTDLPTYETSLSEAENRQNFSLYLKGLETAYDHTLSQIESWLVYTRQTQLRNPEDTGAWALTEGQIAGLLRIQELIRTAKENDDPTHTEKAGR